MTTDDVRMARRAAVPESAEGVSSHGHRVGAHLRWLFWRHLAFGGLVGSLVFFALSLTPSLLPRGFGLQGVVSGVSAVIGYGLGSAGSSTIRKLMRGEPGPGAKRAAWWGLLVGAVVVIPLFLALGRSWQGQARELMGMPQQEAWRTGAIVVIAVVVAYVLLVVSRLVRALGRRLVAVIDLIIPRPIAVVGGVSLTAVLVLGVIQGFLLDPAVSALDSTFSVVNEGTSDGVVQPTASERSGSEASVVPWDSLGVKGRDFVGKGPSAEDISAFTGDEAEDPIRVYVGLESGDTLAERVDLAMRELDRTGAWDREVLAVFTTTGTGWVDPQAADPLEYIHDGDTAEVALQYSYLPSWISFLVDQEKAAAAGRELITAIQSQWAALPEDDRPALLLFGESLGSFGTESAFSDAADMVASVDGALLVGPVFRNDIHSTLTDRREDGTPFWRPVYDGGRDVRFAVAPPDLRKPGPGWGENRVVYLQNASDPITYWTPDLLWRPPDWLDDPRGPDVTSVMFYMPVITFFQTAADLAFSTGVPQGHGHVYGVNQIDSWVAIHRPDGWTAEDTRRLRALAPGSEE